MPSLIVPRLRQSLIELIAMLQSNQLENNAAFDSGDMDDIFGHALSGAPYGGIPSFSVEFNGTLSNHSNVSTDNLSPFFCHPPVMQPAFRLNAHPNMPHDTMPGMVASKYASLLHFSTVATAAALGRANFGRTSVLPRTRGVSGGRKNAGATKGAGSGAHASPAPAAGQTGAMTGSGATLKAAAAAMAAHSTGPSAGHSSIPFSAAARDAQCKEILSLLAHVVRETRAVARPYVISIYRALRPFMLPRRNVMVRSYALDVAGELCLAGQGCMQPFTDELVQLALHVWQGQAFAARRRSAVLALGQVVQGTNYGIDFYGRFPQLPGILLEALKMESGARFRRQLLHTLGTIGAVDITGHHESETGGTHRQGRLQELSEDDVMTGRELDGMTLIKTPFELHALKGSEEFFTAAAVNSLVAVAVDTSLVHLHPHVMRAFMVMVRYMGQECLGHLNVIVSSIVNITYVSISADAAATNSNLADLGKLVRLAQHRIVDHMPMIAQLLFQVWNGSTEVIFLTEQLIAASGDAIRGYMPILLARISESFAADRATEDKSATQKLLRVLATARPHLQGYLALVVPVLIRLLPEPTAAGAEERSVDIGRQALLALLVISTDVSLREHVSMLVHRLVRLLSISDLVDECMLLLAVLARELANDFTELGYVRLINATTVPLRIQNAYYDEVLRCLMNGDAFPDLQHAINKLVKARGFQPFNTTTVHQHQTLQLAVDQEHLRTAWQISSGATAQDWSDWLRRTTRAMLKETPSTAIRACSRLAEIHAPVGRDLFNAAFVSCWPALYEEVQEELVAAFEMVLRHPETAPREIRQVILDLAEFTESMNKGRLPLPPLNLAGLACENRSYAKALRFKEQEFNILVSDSHDVVYHGEGAVEYSGPIEYYNSRLASTLASTPLVSGDAADREQPLDAAVVERPVSRSDRRRSTAPTGLMQKAQQALSPSTTKSRPVHLGRTPSTGPHTREDALEPALDGQEEVIDLEEALADCIEKLIEMNNALMLPEAAAGVLNYAAENDMAGSSLYLELVPAAWYEKLGQWDVALRRYGTDPDPLAAVGRLRCLHALGRWGDYQKEMRLMWPQLSTALPEGERLKVLQMACMADIGLTDWEGLERRVAALVDSDDSDSLFYRAVAAVHGNDFIGALKHVDSCRNSLDVLLTTVWSESYTRAYEPLLRIQQLTELEEIVRYKRSQLEGSQLAMGSLRQLWSNRVRHCQRRVSVWQQVLNLRLLVLHPRDCTDVVLEFVDVCHEHGALATAENALRELLGPSRAKVPLKDLEVTNLKDLRVAYACARHLWRSGQRHEAQDQLQALTRLLRGPARSTRDEGLASGRPQLGAHGGATASASSNSRMGLRARCLYTLAQWKAERWVAETVRMQEGPDENWRMQMESVQQLYSAACDAAPRWHAAWHAHAMVSLRGLEGTNAELRHLHKEEEEELEARSTAATATAARRRGAERSEKWCARRAALEASVARHAVEAAKSFLRAIGLAQTDSRALQDGLRLLGVWFAHGQHPEVRAAVARGRATVALHVWAGLIPQMVARIDHPVDEIRESTHNWLLELGKQHPHALIMPLRVATTAAASRTGPANALLERLRVHHPRLVQDTVMMAEELVRVSSLWQEMWHSALTDASRLLFDDGDAEASCALLRKTHAATAAPATPRELAFYQGFKPELSAALQWLDRWERSRSRSALNNAWGLYYKVYKRVARMLPKLQTLTLHDISPRLAAATGLMAAVPGVRTAPTSGLGDGDAVSRGDNGTGAGWADDDDGGLRGLGAAEWLGEEGGGGARERRGRGSVNGGVPPLLSGTSGAFASDATADALHQGQRSGAEHVSETRGDPSAYGVGDGGGVLTVSHFLPSLSVIQSKQRPRRLRLVDVHGHTHQYLLKGQDDPRMDERVMAFLGLVNNLIAGDPRTRGRFMPIRRFSITAVSETTGLMGWLHRCDTLYSLIRSHRLEKSKVPLLAEQAHIRQLAPEPGGRARGPDSGYESLPLVNKVEIFLSGCRQTRGDDLAQVLWLKSPDSETWVRRRTNYMHSLAMMSVTGYVLGLGDRHLSNIMLDRETGQVVHIDFGDCFEAAQLRRQYAERVPFRLTRVLRRAMEVGATEGTFSVTCRDTLTVLRENKDSLMAVLEAFIHDPLLSWRLAHRQNVRPAHAGDEDGDDVDASAAVAAALSPGAHGLSAENAGDDRPSIDDLVAVVRYDRELERMEARMTATPGGVEMGAMPQRRRKRGSSPDVAGEDAGDGDDDDGVFASGEYSAAGVAGGVVNSKALALLRRVELKLEGLEFDELEQVGG
jgi:hypothetical protein